MDPFKLLNPSVVTTTEPQFTGFGNDPYASALWGAFNQTTDPTLRNMIGKLGFEYMSPDAMMERQYNQRKMLADEEDRQLQNALAIGQFGGEVGNADLQSRAINTLLQAMGGGIETQTSSQPRTYAQKSFEDFINAQKGLLNEKGVSENDYTLAQALSAITSPEQYNQYQQARNAGSWWKGDKTNKRIEKQLKFFEQYPQLLQAAGVSDPRQLLRLDSL